MKHFIAPQFDQIYVAGVGGTGSYLAAGLIKMLAGYDMSIDVCFVDPDIVEEKNCYRQNFFPTEIGEYKAQALAWRLGTQYGMAIGHKNARIENDLSNSGWADYSTRRLVITCVDKVEPRKRLKRVTHWLDIGNDLDYGQAIYGTTEDDKELEDQISSWDEIPTVKALPNAYKKLNMSERSDDEKSQPGCADMPFAEQGVFVNEWAAQAGLAILHQLLVLGSVKVPAIYFNFTRAQMVSASIKKDYLLT
jgi:PRTRC genetic system ThiF family protein